MITMTVYHTDGREEVVETDLPPRPNAYTEHVNVLVGSRYTDMFVDEDGLSKNLPRNEKATAMMAFIVGPAVVFSDRVWY